jgi:hypothetical protein
MTNATNGNDPLSFAYWVPNVSGGLVVSKIPQRTDWNLDYNVKLAQIAEKSVSSAATAPNISTNRPHFRRRFSPIPRG